MIVAYDGFDDLVAVGPCEVFSHAQTRGADSEVGLWNRRLCHTFLLLKELLLLVE